MITAADTAIYWTMKYGHAKFVKSTISETNSDFEKKNKWFSRSENKFPTCQECDEMGTTRISVQCVSRIKILH